MPKRGDIDHILIIGAGPIVIGQACEFDYSGTQACKALMAEGYRVTLINSNPATIMTDPQTAHRVYIEPITPDFVTAIIEKEKPDAILPTVGGQTALNCCLALHKLGVLDKNNVEILGAKPDVIERAEDRQQFNEVMKKIGLEVPKNVVVSSLEDALYVLDTIGLPAIIRPSFTLGGAGGGIAYTKEAYRKIVENGLMLSPTHEVLIDESVLGWKEYEMEVVRDQADNCIIVCSIENIDPMGMHTGDSMTVAPAQTLTDKEYQHMRNAAIKVLRAIGVETGGSNVQFAVNPQNGRLLVIEMNPRVSRSSALASKATGFPIAKVAAKLAVGYLLDEIKNDITQSTPASFEPSIDYVVTKIPRFSFEKFKGTSHLLSSSMRSVGEVMAIGRSFTESLQKALCSMEKGYTGLNAVRYDEKKPNDQLSKKVLHQRIKKQLEGLLPTRLLIAADALRWGITVDEVQSITKYDPWFIQQIALLIKQENLVLKNCMSLSAVDKAALFDLKKMGFSDAYIATMLGETETSVRQYRHQFGLHPVFKMIDTCAGEFDSYTPYLYSCYEGDGLTKAECESTPSTKRKVVILGSGPNRIGQGLEFDYACTHAALAISEAGFESIMINCNPETVSTDYDTSDKLYFEPLSLEYVLEILLKEQQNGELFGVVVQLGGQTPLKLAKDLQDLGFPIIGTSPDSINLAEDRKRFKQLLDQLNLQQPPNTTCVDIQGIEKAIESVGYPAIIRPSNVLGGRAMEILNFPSDLQNYLHHHHDEIKHHGGSILVDKFLENAMEIDVDALSDGKQVYIAGIMEHIERAGVHSGDSTSVLPTKNVSDAMLNQIQDSAYCLARALNVVGLMNVQYAIQDDQLYVLEVNPRASRTVPFVAKSTGVAVAKIATGLMLGQKLSGFNLAPVVLRHFSVKEAVFPFARFAVDDILLRPEMQSTGEVMGIASTFEQAFYKAQLGAGYDLKTVQNVFVDFSAKHVSSIYLLIDQLINIGIHVLLPSHIYQTFFDQSRSKISELTYEDVLIKIKAGDIHLLLDIDTNSQEAKVIRKTAYFHTIPHATTLEMAKVMSDSLQNLHADIGVRSMQEYFI